MSGKIPPNLPNGPRSSPAAVTIHVPSGSSETGNPATVRQELDPRVAQTLPQDLPVATPLAELRVSVATANPGRVDPPEEEVARPVGPEYNRSVRAFLTNVAQMARGGTPPPEKREPFLLAMIPVQQHYRKILDICETQGVEPELRVAQALAQIHALLAPLQQEPWPFKFVQTDALGELVDGETFGGLDCTWDIAKGMDLEYLEREKLMEIIERNLTNPVFIAQINTPAVKEMIRRVDSANLLELQIEKAVLNARIAVLTAELTAVPAQQQARLAQEQALAAGLRALDEERMAEQKTKPKDDDVK